MTHVLAVTPATRSSSGVFACLVVAVCFSTACARPMLSGDAQVKQPAAQTSVVELWSDPTDLAQRDLFWGGSRRAEAPSTDEVFTVLKVDKTGYSDGYNVKGPDGREWDIKVGDEVQTEIVLSRIFWALGYHQPQTFYVTGWQLMGNWEKEGEPARFRLQSDHESDSEWAWLENPFAGTRPLQGLVAISLILNNWDFKTSNNRVYRLRDDRAEPAKRYVVQDLGASLGEPRGLPYVRGTRNRIDDFESHQLIRKVDGSKVQLDYRGPHTDVLKRLTPADVVWGCELLNRLSDAQLDDAFRAADYAPEIRERYIAKIRSKIREGLALRTTSPQVAAEGQQ
jgi:hypothetical protein